MRSDNRAVASVLLLVIASTRAGATSTANECLIGFDGLGDAVKNGGTLHCKDCDARCDADPGSTHVHHHDMITSADRPSRHDEDSSGATKPSSPLVASVVGGGCRVKKRQRLTPTTMSAANTAVRHTMAAATAMRR